MILALIALATLQTAAPKVPPIDLAALAGKSFTQEKNWERVSQISEFIQKSFGAKDSHFFAGGPTTHVWRVGKRFLIFEELETGMHPGNNFANVAVFDENQKPVRCTNMIVGYRAGIKGTKPAKVPGVGVFTFRMDIWWERGPETAVYFAMDGDRVALLRVEDSKGEIFRNNYIYPNWTLGPPAPEYSKDSLLALLRSSDRLQKLEAMTWLAGEHVPPYQGNPTVYAEPLPTAVRYASLSQDSEVRHAVAVLATGTDAWLAQAAKTFQTNWQAIEPAKGTGQKVTDKLLIEDMVVGKGSEFIPGDRVVGMEDDIVISYFATLPNGVKIDASPIRLSNIRLENNMRIEGLTRGLLGMRVGGKRKLTIPADLAYGDFGAGKVPPNCDVIYTVRLHHIENYQHPMVNHVADIKAGRGVASRVGDKVTFLETLRRMDGSLVYERRTKSMRIVDQYRDQLSDLLTGMRVGGIRKAVMNPFGPDDYGSKIFEVEVLKIGR